jgi:hypothetical protein
MFKQPREVSVIKSELLKTPTSHKLWVELLSAVQLNKAVWTSSYTSSLPDDAFAIIVEGGEKDEDGKTTPRSLRKLPHHIETVTDPEDDTSVDWPHLLNAKARVSQVEGITEEQRTAAEEHLQGHFDRIKASGEVSDSDIEGEN